MSSSVTPLTRKTADGGSLRRPEIVERSKETIPWYETCLSVPEIEVKVMRNQRVKVRWQKPEDGSVQEAWFEDYESVIVQHELDHLMGTVLLDRASRFKRARYIKAKKAKARAKAAEVRA